MSSNDYVIRMHNKESMLRMFQGPCETITIML
jgi:hypothetical protein